MISSIFWQIVGSMNTGALICLTVWTKLKRIKCKLKDMHQKDFKGINDRIDSAKQLDLVQTQLQTHNTDTSLLHQEHLCFANLRKWLKADEIAMIQKSRLQWLTNGDSNHKFFYSAVKERNRINRISLLYNDNNDKLVKPLV